MQRNYVSQSNLDNYANARDIAYMLYYLIIGKFESIDSEFMAKNFSIEDKVAEKGLLKYIPDEYGKHNHNGVRTDQYNEAAIIAGDDALYIVVVMSDGGVQDIEAKAIAEAGDYIHQKLTA